MHPICHIKCKRMLSEDRMVASNWLPGGHFDVHHHHLVERWKDSYITPKNFFIISSLTFTGNLQS